MELSLCMIVRNEEECLERCLQSVRDAVDEIVIVDTGSTDATKEIAKRYAAHIHDELWRDDFAHARNVSLSLATKPFILWLDADDVLDAPELEKLIALKQRLTEDVDAVMMPYHYAFSPDGRPTILFERERIVRRAAGFSFCGAVHEAMQVSGNVISENIVIRHTGDHGKQSNQRNLAIYERQIAKGNAMTPRDWYYYARELGNAGRHEQAIQAYEAFLAMDAGGVNRQDALLERGKCLEVLGRRMEAKRSYLAVLEKGEPRAEILCALGACFLAEGDLQAACVWYRAALLCRMPARMLAFIQPDAYGYIPLMQLCVILSRMGEEEEACRMNEQALLLHPGDPAALHNRAYFARRLKKDRQDMENNNWGSK